MKEQLKQSNFLTRARYEYTAAQKNIMYSILGFVQELMFKPEDLPEIIKIDLPVANLAGMKNHSKIIEQIKSLMKKPIDYNFSYENRQFEAVTTLISHAQHEIGSSFVQIELPKKSIILLTNMIPGYTEFKRKIAMELKSLYAKRMYELISRWKDKKGFSMRIDELKDMLAVADKYEKYSAFKKYVLESSKKELKAKADLYFEYKEIKVGRRYEKIDFVIVRKKEEELPPRQRNIFEPADEKSQRCILKLKDLGITRPDLIKEIVSKKQPQFWKWLADHRVDINSGKYENPGGVVLKELGLIG